MKRIFTPIIALLFLLIHFSTTAQTVSTFYQNAGVDDGLAMDSYGNLYGAQYMGSTVWKITPTGVRTAFMTGLNSPNGIAFDSQGYLYVVDNQGGAIHKVDSDGMSSPHVPSIFSPSGIVKMPASDTMIVSSWEGDKLHKVAPDGNVSDYVVGMGLEGPVGLVYNEEGRLFVGNYNDRWIFEVSAAGVLDTLTKLAVPGNNIGFISYRDNHIYATIPWDHKIYKVDMEGNYEIFAGATAGSSDGDVSTATFNGPNGILLSPDGSQFYISDFNTQSVRLISDLDVVNSSHEFLHHSTIKESQLFPNPATHQSILNFTLESPQRCTLKIYNSQGQLINIIFEHKNFPLGMQQVAINTNALNSGIYFLALTTAAGDEIVKKLRVEK